MTEYTSKDIRVLSDRDYVRERTSIYLGNTNAETRAYPILSADTLIEREYTFVPAVLKAVSEIIDNCVDEFRQFSAPNRTLTITADCANGKYEISDNGRGIPIDKHETGKYTPEVALASLKAGRNFKKSKAVGVLGQNGVGAACVNYCSTIFRVSIVRDGKHYTQEFLDGCSTTHEPVIKKTKNKVTGTTISFSLDKRVFGDVSLPEDIVRNRAIEIAATNPGVTVRFQGDTYSFPGGMADIVGRLMAKSTTPPVRISLASTSKAEGEFYIAVGSHAQAGERMFTWVNSSLLINGGLCNTQFCNALFAKMAEYINKRSKRSDSTASISPFLRHGLTIFASLSVSDPDYDSQAKTRLTGPNIRKELDAMVELHWPTIQSKLSGWMNNIASTIAEQQQNDANDKAVSEFDKQQTRTARARRPIEGLLDANSSNRLSCSVLITEGLSAKSQICAVRNPDTTAAFALTGKINNVYGATPAQLLKMGKLSDLLMCIGLTPSRTVDRSKLRYGKIVIATDADYDGGDIFTLLVNLFFQFWPSLFDPAQPAIVHRLVAPNVCAVKGNKRIHFSTREEYEAVAHKYKGYQISYFKGLGSMNKQDWEMCLANPATWIPITDSDHQLASVLKLLFSDDSADRKIWLQTHDTI